MNGGPIALAGFRQRDLAHERRWISRQDHLDGLALAQLAPDPLPARLAIHRGYGRGGMLCATVVGAWTRAVTDVWTAVLALATFIVLLQFKVSELWLIGAAAIIGLVLNGAT